MTQTPDTRQPTGPQDSTSVREVDVVVIGAGFSGMYALYRLQSSSLSVIGFEAGDGVGGTWYWNRYPGARVDIESMQYSYSFDDALQQEWQWPEHFSAQPDLEAYANHVADRFDIRDMIQFSTRVTQLTFDEGSDRWHVLTDQGDRVTARWVIAATGSLDATNVPDWPGLDDFEGDWYHTSKWPKDGVDFTGKRVGLIGTGSTGIQVTPVVAEQAGHLTVFQRTPNFSVPSLNRPLEPDYVEDWRQNYSDRRKEMRGQPLLTMSTGTGRSMWDYTPEEREQIMERAWRSRNGFELVRCFNDVSTDIKANDVLAEFVRTKIRAIVSEPDVAELLCPKTYPIGAKRICVDTGYFESFNRENVTLVDVHTDPITGLTPQGLATTAATYELDAIILATGFDAMTGAMERMDITGVGGVRLQDKWGEGPTTYLGMVVSGFPNLFMVHGPHSPSVRAQMIMGGELQVDWILDVIDRLEDTQVSRLDTTPEWEQMWLQEVDTAADRTLLGQANSWFVGANIPGKPRVFMIYSGGFDQYYRHCTDAIDNDFRGFELSNRREPIGDPTTT